jgi:peptidoglycan/xylan/chitin deacetylase (PgdA/CDA1 family)
VGPVTRGQPLANVCFHGIGEPRRELEPGEGRYWIGVDEFHRILDAVADHPEVRISFDDGNTSDVAYGLPALRERGLTATFFVLAGRLGDLGSLDEDDVRQLADEGMTIGSHGMDHASWRRMDTATATRELVEARERLSATVGTPVTEAACPRGQYDRRALGQLRRAGYDAVHTSDRAAARDGAWLQPRFSVVDDDTAETIRRDVLTPPTTVRRLERSAARFVKRWR